MAKAVKKNSRKRDKKLTQLLTSLHAEPEREARSPVEKRNHIVQSLAARGVALSEEQQEKLLLLLVEKGDRK